MTKLEELPGRMDDLTLQVSQLRTEMGADFCEVRGEMRAEFAAVRAEMREHGVTIVTTLRQEIAEQGQRTDARISDMATGSEMRALYEDVISRIALLQEGQQARTNRKAPRKKPWRSNLVACTASSFADTHARNKI